MTVGTGGLRAAAGMAVLWLGLAGCRGELERERADAGIGAAAAADAAFASAQDAWREQRHADLLATDGWTSLAGLHWIRLDAHYIGSSRDSGIRLQHGPPRLGLLQRIDGKLYLTPERGAGLTVGGVAVDRRIELLNDRSGTPTRVDFDGGRGRLTVIARGGRQALRVRHVDAAARRAFTGIDYWPADPSWRVRGRFVAHPPGQTMQVASIAAGTWPMANPGVLEFELDGRTFRLQALEGRGGSLFVALADLTSGQDSYGAGRYLDVDPPDADGRVVLDFNRAYNPPCAFTDYATCPLPPLENRLDLAIVAGEKAHAPPTG